eukprot:TRINITY_DN720_c0_g1_i1.p1 TRINITY_DN720_c0_g1~~TRINITY_DN720_c0_g1_i1.p1  ORF type:complete len:112 (-),score=21.52 TRINITY_DN720_c0_g1_i1:327-662(-)
MTDKVSFKCAQCDFPLTRMRTDLGKECPKCHFAKPYAAPKTEEKKEKKETKTTTKKSGGDIFSRLTDSSKYSGTHKNRFDSSGKGLGKSGRTQDTAGVTNISTICRPNLHP